MTPDQLTAWVLPIALATCVLMGFSTLVVSIRTAWIMRSIAWATVGFGLMGASVMLAPKWSQIVLEFGSFKAHVAQLNSENLRLASENARLNDQIAKVASLGTQQFGTAGEAIASIKNARDAAQWAGFLPDSPDAYRLEIPAKDPGFAASLGQALDVPADKVTEAFEQKGYTVLKVPTAQDLAQSPANELWIAPK